MISIEWSQQRKYCMLWYNWDKFEHIFNRERNWHPLKRGSRSNVYSLTVKDYGEHFRCIGGERIGGVYEVYTGGCR